MGVLLTKRWERRYHRQQGDGRRHREPARRGGWGHPAQLGGAQGDEALDVGAQSDDADLPKGLFHGDLKQGQRQTVERVRRIDDLDALREQRALLHRGIVWGWICAASRRISTWPPGPGSAQATSKAAANG